MKFVPSQGSKTRLFSFKIQLAQFRAFRVVNDALR